MTALWDERYRLIEHLGDGAAASAYKAEDSHSGKIVALKILRDEKLAEEKFTGEILGDAFLRQQLQHPFIVPVFHFSRTPRAYSVAEFSAQHKPSDALDKRRPAANEIVAFAHALTGFCLGLNAAGIVWRDISSSNVCLADGDAPWANLCLTDLGSFSPRTNRMQARLFTALGPMSRQNSVDALVTQARRVRVLLRFVALYKGQEAPEELRPWLEHAPAVPHEELPLDHWAKIFAIAPLAIAER